MEERKVDVFRYKMIRNNGIITTDENLETISRKKNNLLLSFSEAVKEAAIDCELNKNHNMMASKYRCFKFNEISLFDKNIGPAYKEDMFEDMKNDNGSNSTKTVTIKVKAIKIKGVIKIGEKEDISTYWYCPKGDCIDVNKN